MARQNISVGTVANDGTGDPLRTGMQKVNANFTELYTDAPISNTVTVGNTTVNTFINSTSISSRNLTLSGDLTVTGNVSFEGETLFSNAINITTTDKMFILANGTANATAANSSGIAIHTFANLVYIAAASGWQSNVNIVPAANNLTIGNTTSVWAVYANTINAVSASLTGTLAAGNTTITGFANISSTLAAGNTTITGFANISSTLAAGNTTITGFANISSTLAAGNTTITGFVNATSNINALSHSVGSSFVANQSGIFHVGMVEAADLHVNSYFIANTTRVTIASGVALSVNGSIGTGGQVLTSNGSSVYWDTIAVGNTSGAVNVDAQYSWTNLHVFSANVHLNGNTNITNAVSVSGNVTFSNTVSVSGNVTFSNTVSVSGNVTFSNTVSVSGNVTFSNTVSVSGNVTFSNTITANGSVGTSGQVLTTNGTGVYWANASGGTSIALNANNTDTSTYYLPMSNTDTGTWANGVVSNTIYYTPSTGTLSATVFNSLSDKEKKENIKTITDAIEIISQINGVRFDWKNNHQPSAGLIAQDVEKVMPELVQTDPVSGDKSLNYSGVIAVLVEAVKYLINKG